jgi:redox-sensitive bicupin YhaK (pirin superfamily)
VRRALPSAKRQMIGPFIFFDQMGPAEFLAGKSIDVRPHPHTGLATVTCLFEGEMMHRDSLGSPLAIRPGELNLMTTGRGIAHLERTAPEQRASGQRLFGIQSWMALPKSHEESEPGFAHHSIDDLPRINGEGKRVRFRRALRRAVRPPRAPSGTQADSGRLGASAKRAAVRWHGRQRAAGTADALPCQRRA